MQPNNNKQHKVSLVVGICIAVFLGIIVANVAGGFIQQLLIGLLSALTPIITALVVIFLAKHIMFFLETRILNKVFKKMPQKFIRIFSLIISLLVILGFVGLIVYMFVPRTVSIITELVNNKEKYIYQLQNEVSELLSAIFGTNAEDMVANLTASLYAYIETTFNNFLPQLIQISTSTISIVGQVILGFTLAVIYLLDKERVNAYIGRMAKVQMKPETVAQMDRFLKKSDKILIDFVIAKVIECIVLTVCLGLVLAIVGVNFAFELAFIMGVLNVIPYIGFIISLLPTVLITMIYGSVSLALQALIFVSIAYIFLTSFVTPFIIGKRIRMNMIVMFLSMIIGGGLFGIMGMMIGVPIGAIISEFVIEKVQYKEEMMRNMNLPSTASNELDLKEKDDSAKKTKVKRKEVKAVKIKEEKNDSLEDNVVESKKSDDKSKEQGKSKRNKIGDIFKKIKENYTNIATDEPEEEIDSEQKGKKIKK